MVDSRHKGKRVEYLIRDLFRQAGFECHRVPTSGNAQGFKGDLDLEGYRIEIKARKSLKLLYDWFNQAPDGILMVKANNKKPLVVLDFDLFCKMFEVFINYDNDNSVKK